MSKPGISHHLDILKRADLIAASKKGQYVICTINTTVVEDLFQWICSLKSELNEKKTAPGGTVYGADRTPGSLPG